MAYPPYPANLAHPAPDLRGGDPVLDLLVEAPFHIARPRVQTVPFIFASPHSGRHYPASLVAQSRLDPLTLRRSEDAFVDELFACVPDLGAPLLTAKFPRAYCDANRGPGEIDVHMFAGPLTVPVDPPSPRVTAGLGVIPRIVRDGAEIYGRKLDAANAALRLTRLYHPYHAALQDLVEETLARFGNAIVVDCHSMPSALAVPDIVLGDRYGASAPGLLTAWTETAFGMAGFSLARNTPYAGGFTTIRHGRAANCHALQIEINRSLYIDEDSITRRPGFGAMQKRLADALARLTKLDHTALHTARTIPTAAE